MSNRLLGLLIILGFILLVIAYYLYAFVTYTGGLHVQSNVGEYTITLSGNKALDKNNSEIFCEESLCTIPKLSPFEYRVFITKDGYKSVTHDVLVPRKEMYMLDIVLERDVSLTSVQEKFLTTTGVEENIQTSSGAIISEELDIEKTEEYVSPKERIEKLRKKKKYYTYFDGGEVGEIFFEKKAKTLHLGVENVTGNRKHLQEFSEIVPKQEIFLHKVIGSDSQIVIEYGETNFLYDQEKSLFEKLDLTLDIEYVKVYNKRVLAFVTDKGMFLYDESQKNKFEYSINYFDSVYHKGNIIGLIKESDEVRKKTFSTSQNQGDIIVLHNPKTQVKRHIFSPNFKVEKMYVKGASVILEGASGEQFILENYE